MGCDGQADIGGDCVGELQAGGGPVQRLIHQSHIGKPHIDLAGQGCNGRIGSVDTPVTADGFNPVKVIGVCNVGRNDIAERSAVAFDGPVEMAKASAFRQHLRWQSPHPERSF
jgi:hypothetical protein